MNDITQALQKAGVKIPSQNQRIWTYLKDFGPHTVRDIAAETKIAEASVQSAITVMVKGKMLEKIERVNHKGVRIHNHYGAIGKQFERLPAPVRRGDAAPTENAADAPGAPAAPEFNPAHLLADCTLSQMRQVYSFLGRMFK